MRALHLVEVGRGAGVPVEGTGRVIPADLVLLALGFSGPDRYDGLVDQLGWSCEPRGTIARDAGFATNVPGCSPRGTRRGGSR